MPSAAEVAELRREGELLDLDHVDATLKSTPEVLAFMIAELRAAGATEAEVLDSVELLARAAEIDREDLRSARATLKALNYPAALTALLTALARRAKPKHRWTPPGWDGPRTHPIKPAVRQEAPDLVDHGALAMWTQPKPGPARR